eukprot:COSAG05_NODE_11521_length_509_cov_1.365854_1_plen_91_part_10
MLTFDGRHWTAQRKFGHLLDRISMLSAANLGVNFGPKRRRDKRTLATDESEGVPPAAAQVAEAAIVEPLRKSGGRHSPPSHRSILEVPPLG